MITSHPQLDIQLSSDEAPAPFIGKYHHVLRNRKNTADEAQKPPKKEYKKKRIEYKSFINIYQQWKLELPLSQNHVYNFHNILAINEQSMRDPSSEESFISSKFYMKKVKQVNIHNNSILFRLEDAHQDCTPIPYICERLKSLGDAVFLQMALTIQHLQETLPEINKKLQKEQESDQVQLQGFLSEMKDKLFFSQYSPHLLIISGSLLQLLGFDVQQFAIESIKHKSILYEFFSAQNYSGVIHKHLENIKLLKDYLQNRMTLDQFCQKSLIVYNDFVYNRANKKIKCQFFAGTSKQLTPYIEIKQIKNDAEELRNISPEMLGRKRKIEQFKETHRSKEIQLLKKLTNIPKQLDPSYKQKICTYRMLECLLDDQSSGLEL